MYIVQCTFNICHYYGRMVKWLLRLDFLSNLISITIQKLIYSTWHKIIKILKVNICTFTVCHYDERRKEWLLKLVMIPWECWLYHSPAKNPPITQLIIFLFYKNSYVSKFNLNAELCCCFYALLNNKKNKKF